MGKIVDLIEDSRTDDGFFMNAWMEETKKEIDVTFQFGFICITLPISEFKQLVNKLNSAYSALEEKGL